MLILLFQMRCLKIISRSTSYKFRELSLSRLWWKSKFKHKILPGTAFIKHFSLVIYLKILSVGEFDNFLDKTDSAFPRNLCFDILVIATLREKCSNMEFFLVCIQPKNGKIRTSKISLFGQFYEVQLTFYGLDYYKVFHCHLCLTGSWVRLRTMHKLEIFM